MKRQKKNYTTISVTKETRMYLDEVKRRLMIENNGRFIDLNEVIEWLLKEAGYIV